MPEQAEEMAMIKKSDQKMLWFPFSDESSGFKKTPKTNNNKPPEQVLAKQAGSLSSCVWQNHNCPGTINYNRLPSTYCNRKMHQDNAIFFNQFTCVISLGLERVAWKIAALYSKKLNQYSPNSTDIETGAASKRRVPVFTLIFLAHLNSKSIGTSCNGQWHCPILLCWVADVKLPGYLCQGKTRLTPSPSFSWQLSVMLTGFLARGWLKRNPFHLYCSLKREHIN